MNLLNQILDGIKKHIGELRKAVGIGTLVIGVCGVAGWVVIAPAWVSWVLLSGGILSLD